MSDKISVLGVNDDQTVRNGLTAFLNLKGFSLKFATNEREAVDLLNDGYRPDTAFIDVAIDMGGKYSHLDNLSYGLAPGVRLARYLNSIDKGCRIIMASGFREKYTQIVEFSNAWGLYTMGDVVLLENVLKLGRLRDEEMGKPVMDIKSEFGRRSVERG
jgi:CheY-like chemotaxis protein